MHIVPAVTRTVNELWDQFAAPASITAVAFYILVAVALWKVFVKAGRPGFLALIPIVNLVVLVIIAGRSGWLALLYLIPVVNIVFAIIVALDLGKRFGKGAGFSIFLLWLFPIIGYLILGFGSAEYRKA